MKTNGWISAWCSKIGSSHIEKGLPCQDFSQVKYIRGANFAIAAVSDGAGSCENSDTGSRFLVVNAIRKISVRLVRNRFYADGNPGLDETLWRELAFGIFTELKAELGAMAEKEHLDFRSLSATLILAISDGSFVACANVGDGRAAFRNRESEWFPMLVPTKGEEANQTLFITSDLWDCGRDSEYFWTFFCKNPISAFSLLSDGCEKASFEMLKYDGASGKFFDPNTPFKPFFEPNYQNLLRLKRARARQAKINESWESFIEKWNRVLVSETDDKSMVLSAFVSDDIHEPNS